MSEDGNAPSDGRMLPKDMKAIVDAVRQTKRTFQDASDIWRKQVEEWQAPAHMMATHIQSMNSGALFAVRELVAVNHAINTHLESLQPSLEAVQSLIDGPRRLAEAFRDLVKPIQFTVVALKLEVPPLFKALEMVGRSSVLELWKEEVPVQDAEENQRLDTQSNAAVIDVSTANPPAAAPLQVPAIVGLSLELTLEEGPYLQILPPKAILLDHRIAIQSEGGSFLYFLSASGWFPERVKPQSIKLIRETWKIRLNGNEYPYKRLVHLSKILTDAGSKRTACSSLSNRIREVQSLCRKHLDDESAILMKSAGGWGLNPTLSHWQRGPYDVHRNVHRCSPASQLPRLAEPKDNDSE